MGADVTSTITAERAVVAALMSGITRPDTPFVFTSGTSALGDTGELVYDESTPIEPHAGAQSGLRTRDIAAAISRGTGWDGRTIELPAAELGRLCAEPALATYRACNSQSSRETAMRLLDWIPRHGDMLDELSTNRTPAHHGRGSYPVKEDHHAS